MTLLSDVASKLVQLRVPQKGPGGKSPAAGGHGAWAGAPGRWAIFVIFWKKIAILTPFVRF